MRIDIRNPSASEFINIAEGCCFDHNGRLYMRTSSCGAINAVDLQLGKLVVISDYTKVVPCRLKVVEDKD